MIDKLIMELRGQVEEFKKEQFKLAKQLDGPTIKLDTDKYKELMLECRIVQSKINLINEEINNLRNLQYMVARDVKVGVDFGRTTSVDIQPVDYSTQSPQINTVPEAGWYEIPPNTRGNY